MNIAGQSFCFTGTMRHSRRAIEKMVRDCGGRVSHKVTRSTDYLVADEFTILHGSQKTADAERLGVEVIAESEFFSAA